MNKVIKNFMLAGIGGTVAYGVVGAVITALITATTAAALFLTGTVPIVIAAGVVWLIVDTAFK